MTKRFEEREESEVIDISMINILLNNLVATCSAMQPTLGDESYKLDKGK